MEPLLSSDFVQRLSAGVTKDLLVVEYFRDILRVVLAKRPKQEALGANRQFQFPAKLASFVGDDDGFKALGTFLNAPDKDFQAGKLFAAIRAFKLDEVFALNWFD